MVIFSCPHSFYIYLLEEFFYKEELSFLPHLFSQSFIYASIRLMDIYFILWVMIFLDYFILLHRLFYFSHLELFQLGLEKAMATHSSVHAWRIPKTAEPGGLPSRGHTESDRTEAAEAAEASSWLLCPFKMSPIFLKHFKAL